MGNAANTHMNTLIILQKCITRRIFKVDRSFPTAPLLKDLNVLPVREIVIYIYVCIYKYVPHHGL